MVCFREWDPRQGTCPPHCLLVPQISGPGQVWGTFCLAEPSILTWVAEFPVCRALLMQTKRNPQQRWSSKWNLVMIMVSDLLMGRIYTRITLRVQTSSRICGGHVELFIVFYDVCNVFASTLHLITSDAGHCLSPWTMNHAQVLGPCWARTVRYLEYLKNSTAVFSLEYKGSSRLSIWSHMTTVNLNDIKISSNHNNAASVQQFQILALSLKWFDVQPEPAAGKPPDTITAASVPHHSRTVSRFGREAAQNLLSLRTPSGSSLFHARRGSTVSDAPSTVMSEADSIGSILQNSGDIVPVSSWTAICILSYL